ncbi:MAG: FAD-binding protein, partial [Clostridia bacterium]|nr:FAD-binding protein [Clostridia bacterium]
MSVINLISLTQKYESETPFAIAKHSTIGCGGSARAAFYPQTAEETEQLISKLQRLQIPYYVVGNMSNVLPADGCSRRVFIVTKQMKRIYETPEKNGLYVEAGASAGALLNECKRVGLS